MSAFKMSGERSRLTNRSSLNIPQIAKPMALQIMSVGVNCAEAPISTIRIVISRLIPMTTASSDHKCLRVCGGVVSMIFRNSNR